jgi:hypothetical protein
LRAGQKLKFIQGEKLRLVDVHLPKLV